MRSLTSKIILILLVGLAASSNSFAQKKELQFVKFTHQPPIVGLITEKQLNLDLSMSTSVNQTILSNLKYSQDQSSTVTLLELTNNKITKVKVAYTKSKRSQTKDKDTNSSNDPVAGKVYFVTVAGDKLQVNDIDGKTPSPAEVAMIKANLESIRKPNPLAVTLSGKTFFIGQTIPFSKKLAKDLFGGQKAIGNFQKLTLKFDSVKVLNGKKCAVLSATITGDGADSSMNLTGTFVVQIDTCRTVSSNFSGPVAIHQKNGSFKLVRKGTVRISMSANYSKTR